MGSDREVVVTHSHTPGSEGFLSSSAAPHHPHTTHLSLSIHHTIIMPGQTPRRGLSLSCLPEPVASSVSSPPRQPSVSRLSPALARGRTARPKPCLASVTWAWPSRTRSRTTCSRTRMTSKCWSGWVSVIEGRRLSPCLGKTRRDKSSQGRRESEIGGACAYYLTKKLALAPLCVTLVLRALNRPEARANAWQMRI